MTHLTQTLFGYVSTFTRFKLADGSGPFVKVGGQTYQDSDGTLTAIVPAEAVFQVPDNYIGGVSGGPTPPSLFTGCVHYWPLNEVSGNNLDLVGSLPLTRGIGVPQVAGPLDFAMQVNDAVAGWYCESANAPSLWPSTGATWSWWEMSTITPGNYNAVGQYSAYSNGNEAVSWEPDFFGSTLDWKSDSAQKSLSINGAPPNDVLWHNFVMRRSNNVVEFWMDGSLIASKTPDLVGTVSASKPVVIGERTGTNPATPVNVSDLCIWDRALTDAEIITLYNGGTPLRPT